MSGQPSEAHELVCNGSRDSGRGLPWKARTHCGYGHEFTPENTMWRVDSSGRRCRECKRKRDARWYRERGRALVLARRAQRNKYPQPERKTA